MLLLVAACRPSDTQVDIITFQSSVAKFWLNRVGFQSVAILPSVMPFCSEDFRHRISFSAVSPIDRQVILGCVCFQNHDSVSIVLRDTVIMAGFKVENR